MALRRQRQRVTTPDRCNNAGECEESAYYERVHDDEIGARRFAEQTRDRTPATEHGLNEKRFNQLIAH